MTDYSGWTFDLDFDEYPEVRHVRCGRGQELQSFSWPVGDLIGLIDDAIAAHVCPSPPRCAHCRKERAECEAAVRAIEWHAHNFAPTRKELWFDCPLCAEYLQRDEP